MNIISHSDIETKQIAKNFAATLTSGAIVCLHGDLGAGKTTFTKGLSEALGLTTDINSPTFTLMNVYQLPTLDFGQYRLSTLIHIDTYRLKSEQELIDIGVEDYLGQPGTITLIEWPEKLTALLINKKVINVTIDHQGENLRKITIA